MPVDPGTPVGVAPHATLEPAPKPAPSPVGQPGRSPQGPAPLAPARPVEPHPALAAFGIRSSVDELNQKVDALTTAHTRAFGTRPAPGLLLDVLRSNVPVDQFGVLFDIPKNQADKRARQALTAAQSMPHQPDPTTTLAHQLAGAIKSNTLPQFIADNHQAVTDAFTDPDSRGQLTRAMYAAGVNDPAQVVQAGLFPVKPSLYGRIILAPMQPASQIVYGVTLGLPLLAFEEGRGIKHSIEQRSFDPFLQTQELLAKSAAKGVVRDVEHPRANIGNLILDSWALASFGAGTVSRAAAAGRAISAGEGAASIARAALSRTPTGTFHLGPGADKPLSSNPLAAQIQALTLEHRLRGLTIGDDSAVPAGAQAVTAAEQAKEMAGGLTDPLGIRTTYLAPENTIQRQLRAADRVANALRLAQLDPVLKATRSQGVVRAAFSRLAPDALRQLSPAEQQAIVVMSLDSLDPFNDFRLFHEKAIADGEGNVAAHRAQLSLLPAAEKAMRNPRPKLAASLNAVRDVSEAQTRLRIQALNLTPETADQRVARVGAIVRGEPTFETDVQASIAARIGEVIGGLRSGRTRSPDARAEAQAEIGKLQQLHDEPTRATAVKLGLLKGPGSGDLVTDLNLPRKTRLLKLTEGAPEVPDEELRARLAELDDRYQAMVTALSDKPGDYKNVTSIQNARAKKRGGPYKPLSDVQRERGEKEMLEMVRRNPDAPGVARFLAEIDEADRIRAELAQRGDESFAQQAVRSARLTKDSFYLPFVSVAHSRRMPGAFWGQRASNFGIPVPASMPELTHAFTGDSIRAGDYRIDATNLIRESYTRTAAVVNKLQGWQRLWDHYSDATPLTDFHVPIRSKRQIDDHLRGLLSKIEQGDLTNTDVAGLDDEMVANLSKFLYPNREDVKPTDEVRWVDERYLDDSRSTRPGKVATTFAVLNEPLRDLTLFARPAYAMNLVGNAGLALIHQGILTVPNLVRAIRAEEFYGKTEARQLQALSGESRSLSYTTQAGGQLTAAGRALGGIWNIITDRHLRMAAVIHELRVQGFRTSAQIKQALRDFETDDEVRKNVTEASQRAKDAMVSMDSLVWFEKTTLRHVLFVYPWLRGSALWSLRFLRDHPAQAALYNEIGQSSELEQDPIMQHLPAWMKEAGVFPTGLDDKGNPIIVNPSSVNTFSTLAQAVGLGPGTSTVADMFGPGATLLLHEVTGRDRFGRVYKDRWMGPALDALTGLPQATAYTRATAQQKPVPALDITRMDGLIRVENAEAKQPTYLPGAGFSSVYGPLLFGGLAQRVLDRAAVDAKFYTALPFPEKVAHDVKLEQEMASLQGELVGKPVPADVRLGLRLSGDRTLAYHAFAAKEGRTPTLHEKTLLDIQLLERKALVTPEDAADLKARLQRVLDDKLQTFRSGIEGDLAYGKQLQEWHQAVVTVAGVANRAKLDEDLQRLVRAKLLPGQYRNAANADDATLATYGRGYLAYADGIKRFTVEAKKIRDAGGDTSEVAARLRAYVDQHTKPVTIDGRALPAYPQLALKALPDSALPTVKARLLNHNWLDLTATDKQLLGYKDDPRVSEALVAFAHYTSKGFLATQYPEGQRYLDAGQRASIIGQLDKSYGLGGKLVRDYELARMPRWQRFGYLDVVQKSPNRQQWTDLLDRAGQVYKLAHPGTGTAHYTVAGVDDAWAAYVSTLVPYLKKSEPGFYKELQPYIAQNPGFLEGLVKGSANG